MSGNYKRLESILRAYWLQPNRAKRFYFDFTDQIDTNTAESDLFEVVFIAIQNTRREGDLIFFNVDVYCLDKRTEGGENSLDVVSDTHQKLTDFESALIEDQIPGIYFEESGVITAIENGMFDGLDGNVMEGLVIEMEVSDYCDAPGILGD